MTARTVSWELNSHLNPSSTGVSSTAKKNCLHQKNKLSSITLTIFITWDKLSNFRPVFFFALVSQIWMTFGLAGIKCENFRLKLESSRNDPKPANQNFSSDIKRLDFFFAEKIWAEARTGQNFLKLWAHFVFTPILLCIHQLKTRKHPTLCTVQTPRMTALTKPSDLATWAQLDGQFELTLIAAIELKPWLYFLGPHCAFGSLALYFALFCIIGTYFIFH